MRKLFGLVAGIAFAATVSAQINVGANFLVGLPSGDWHKAGDESIINTAFGGGIEGNYFVTEDIAVGLEVGYLAFGEKDDLGLTFTAIPITIKGEYYFLDDEFRPFVGLGIGYYLMNSKLEVGEPFDDVEATLNGVGISPRIGAVYPASDLIGIV
jgi:outer membrane protein W